MRFLNFLYANIFGYFWLPCPKCGRMFGGHEAKGAIEIGNGKHKVTCCIE